MNETANAIVALTRCTDYSRANLTAAIAGQLDLLGGLGRFVGRGDTVLLKPNFIAPKSTRHATQTHPAVIIELAKLLKDFGARPFVGDSPAWSNVFTCADKLRLTGPLKKLGVPIKQLNRPKKCSIAGTKVSISSVALDADVIINLPKLKSHQQLVATFAVKNMFGCVSGKSKPYWHFARGKTAEQFCELLIGIYRFLNPALTLIDGIVAMDGPGPINGRARPLGWLIAGTDPVACEVVCSKLINAKPEDFPIIRTARQMHFGCSEPGGVKILGDRLPETGCTDFEPARLIPIRFSFLRVCKSILKQIPLIAKSAIRRTKAAKDRGS